MSCLQWGKWELSPDLVRGAFWKPALDTKDSSKRHFPGSSLFSELARLNTILRAANRQVHKTKFKKDKSYPKLLDSDLNLQGVGVGVGHYTTKHAGITCSQDHSWKQA